MKNTINIIILVWACSSVNAQVCVPHNYPPNEPENTDPNFPYGVSTNPQAPYNPLMPLPYYKNFWDWTATIINDPNDPNSGILDYVPLSNMNGLSQMTNPYLPDNNYSNLVGPGITWTNADFHWANGWELLALNTGYFPDGTEMSSVGLSSSFPNNPTILFYNKQRGIIRLFSNFIGPLTTNPQTVRVKLEFVDPNTVVSGLFRHNIGIDIPLNQPTEVIEVVSVVNFEHNDPLWFYTDFQVGYDPCTCLFNSIIMVSFDLIHQESISMVSNSLSVTTDLVEDGQIADGVDFINNTQYDEATGFGLAGLQIYNEMSEILGNYRLELRKVEEANDAIAANNEQIEKKLALIETIQVVLKIAGALIVPGGAEVAAVAQAAAAAETAAQIISFNDQGGQVTNFISRISNLPETNPEVVTEENSDGSFKIDAKKLFKKGSEYLGKGLDFYSEQLQEQIQNPIPKPKSPTTTLTTTTYSGSITDKTYYGNIKLWNPGTYPEGNFGALQSPTIYPIYNEILGLFAVLEPPAFVKKEASWRYRDVTETVTMTNGATTMANSFSIDLISNHKVGLSLKDVDGLKYTFNPAAGIDFSSPDYSIEAALVVKGSYEDVEALTIDNLYFYVADDPADTYSCNNLSLEPSFGSNEIKPGSFRFESAFVPLDIFTAMAETFEVNFRKIWRIGTGVNTPYNLMTESEILQLVDYEFRPDYNLKLQYQLKVKITMPFVQLGLNGEVNSTTQVFTYDLSSNSFSNVGTYPSSFSLTENPNGNGTMPLQEHLTFQEKNWTSIDYPIYGGVWNGTTTIKPHALSAINIVGNQTRNGNYNVVMTAGEEVTVSGEATIGDGITLAVNNFAGITTIANPQVDNSYLGSFCTGQGPSTYHANVAPRSTSASNNNMGNFEAPKKLETTANISLFPNPASTLITLSLTGINGMAEFTIYNAVGMPVANFRKQLDNGTNLHYVQHNISQLADGIYTIAVRSAEHSLAHKFIVAH